MQSDAWQTQVNERECALKKRTLSLVCEVHGEWQHSVKTFLFLPRMHLFLFIVTACLSVRFEVFFQTCCTEYFVLCVSVCRFTPRLLFFYTSFGSCTHPLHSTCEEKTWQGWWFFSAASKALMHMHMCAAFIMWAHKELQKHKADEFRQIYMS